MKLNGIQANLVTLNIAFTQDDSHIVTAASDGLIKIASLLTADVVIAINTKDLGISHSGSFTSLFHRLELSGS